MIILDTHIWIWWVHGDNQLDAASRAFLDTTNHQLGICAITCWEVAKLAEAKRVTFARPVGEWLQLALNYPRVEFLPLTPNIAVESTQLPGDFHRDPADQIIVATARLLNCPLLTWDAKILRYAHVNAQSSAAAIS